MALRNSISASTGVDVANWTVGGQFEINTRGSESLPVGLLVDSKRHLSQTSAANFFQEFAHVEIYKTFARGIADNVQASVSSSSKAAASAISAEPLTPKRPTCLLKSSVTVQQAYNMISNLTGLDLTAPSSRVQAVLQDADVPSLSSLAALFGVLTGDDVDVYELAIADAILQVFAAVRASPAPPAIVPSSPAGFDLKAMGRSLRDDVAADEVLRSVVALLASARFHLRLTVKALVRRGLMADVPSHPARDLAAAGTDAAIFAFAASRVRVCYCAEIRRRLSYCGFLDNRPSYRGFGCVYVGANHWRYGVPPITARGYVKVLFPVGAWVLLLLRSSMCLARLRPSRC